ncbi:26S proteasome regulatory subunit 8 [Ciona intestinalis]
MAGRSKKKAGTASPRKRTRKSNSSPDNNRTQAPSADPTSPPSPASPTKSVGSPNKRVKREIKEDSQLLVDVLTKNNDMIQARKKVKTEPVQGEAHVIQKLANCVSKLEIDTPHMEAGVEQYYHVKIQDLQVVVNEKAKNVRRLQAQRNELNAKVRMLREELQLLQEQGSYVGEVVKPIDKKKVLVKVHPEGKFVVDIDKAIKIEDVTANCRVALRSDSYVLHKVLPNKVDPLVSLMMVEKVPDSTYEMVGGLDKQIKEIKEVIELPVKHPELFEALGIAQPKGVLLYGPPGTGKTLLARAVAHHTDCTFIRVSGSELVQKFIGEGSRMVRELFVMAREHAPSIIFMDEIDSIGSSRLEGGSGGGDSEVQRTMLELLNQLDGFEAHQNIKVVMATNRIDILDSALLRPGRIDRKIEFPPPNEEARLDILKIHSRKMNLTRGINLRKIAEQMPGASGAEVKGTCTEAGMYALRERRVHVTQEDFEMAVAKIMQKDTERNMSIRKLWK